MNIDQFKPGDVINEQHNVKLLVISLYQGVTKQQTPFVAITLQNKGHKLDWMLWDTTKENAPVKEGNILLIHSAVVEEYNGILKVNNMSYEVVPGNPVEFLPGITDEYRSKLIKEMEEICKTYIPTSHPLFNLVNYILFQSKIGEKFRYVPAAIRIHSAYMGGLLEHSISVTKTALAFAENQTVDKVLLTAGSLLHDIGKTVAYTYNPIIEITPAGALLEHIVLGVMLLTKIINQLRNDDPVWSATFNKEIELKFLHLIASHQSKLEWGSPIQPAIPEAFLLANADVACSQIETYMGEIGRFDSGKSTWSQVMKQFIYKPKDFEYMSIKW